MDYHMEIPRTTTGKVLFTEPKYKKYKIVSEQEEELSHTFDFSKDKIFHEDEIEKNIGSNAFIVCHSPVRKHNHQSGILILANNKTYGKHRDKFIYKCIPDNKYLPTFLIPYGKKNGFKKHFNNLYVTFKFDNWIDLHPRGILNQVIGPVTELSAFYEYQLYCKSLNASIQKFNRETSQKLKLKTAREFIEQIMRDYPNIKDETTNNNIFTIDAASCCDYDDALEYQACNPCKGDVAHVIRIHIANVSLWMDVLNLWDSFSDRISTIYLPDRKRPMLPTCLSECLCSLIEGQRRFVFTFEIEVDDNYDIIKTNGYNSLIKVYKNHVYESKVLRDDENFKSLLRVAQKMSGRSSTKMLPYVKSSHDLVTYFMILMNHRVSRKLIESGDGIFRTAFIDKNLVLPKDLDEHTKNFITAWSSQAGEYVLCKNKQKHEWLDLDTYCHVTSPIRRLVDLLNSIIYQNNFSVTKLSENARLFVGKWKTKLGYINTCMKYIRKVQTECSLLSIFHEENQNGKYDIMKGVLFNRCKRDDDIYIYNVYIAKIKMLTKIKLLEKIENYTKTRFRMFYFKDENTLKQKIRLQFYSA